MKVNFPVHFIRLSEPGDSEASMVAVCGAAPWLNGTGSPEKTTCPECIEDLRANEVAEKLKEPEWVSPARGTQQSIADDVLNFGRDAGIPIANVEIMVDKHLRGHFHVTVDPGREMQDAEIAQLKEVIDNARPVGTSYDLSTTKPRFTPR